VLWSRQRQRPEILRVSSRFAIAGLISLAIAMSATIFLLADVVLGGWPAIVACALTVVGFSVLWFALPLRQREYAAEHRRPDSAANQLRQGH
jgi:hypothetical protein